MEKNPYSAPNVPKPPASKRGVVWLIGRIIVWSVRLVAGLALLLVLAVLFQVPIFRNVREAARRTQCRNNLKQIGVALAKYHEDYACFPPPFTVDSEGNRLHSWRTLLLPYLGKNEVYAKIRLDKPWYNPVNSAAAQTVVPVYLCLSGKKKDHFTSYAAIVSEKSCFAPGVSTSCRDITDGTSNTMLVIEADSSISIPWIAPIDIDDYQMLNMIIDHKSDHAGGFHALLADGTVRFILAATNRPTLLGLTTRAGGEMIDEF